MHYEHDINLLKRGPHYLFSVLIAFIAAETVFPIEIKVPKNEDFFMPSYDHFPIGSYSWQIFFAQLRFSYISTGSQ